MTATMQFHIRLITKGADRLPELQARLSDLTPVLEEIVDKWARGNEDKFAKAEGAQESGADVYGIPWKSLMASTIKRKARLGQPNWIMVATGQLKRSLTDPTGFGRMVTQQSAAFGTPLDFEAEMAAHYNWFSRQTIFLSEDDKVMIEKEAHDYLELGGNWKDIQFSRGLENLRDRDEEATMNADFQDNFHVEQ